MDTIESRHVYAMYESTKSTSTTTCPHPLEYMYQKFKETTMFYHYDIQLDIQSLQGQFHSLHLFDSLVPMMIKTSLFSFDTKILETGSTIKSNQCCRVDFLDEFWNCFLNGFQYLSISEQEMALKSMSMIQVFLDTNKTFYVPNNDVPILCCFYSFSSGTGNVVVQSISDQEI